MLCLRIQYTVTHAFSFWIVHKSHYTYEDNRGIFKLFCVNISIQVLGNINPALGRSLKPWDSTFRVHILDVRTCTQNVHYASTTALRSVSRLVCLNILKALINKCKWQTFAMVWHWPNISCLPLGHRALLSSPASKVKHPILRIDIVLLNWR